MSQPPPLVPPQSVGPPSPPTQPRTCGYAIASLICALLPVPLVGAILAVVFSIKSRRRIARSQGTLTGQGLAIAGMICGILFGGISLIATFAGIAVPVIVATQKKASSLEAMANSKSVGLAMFNFEQDYGWNVYQGRAVVLRIDQSATPMLIRKPDKKLPIDKRHTLLETGTDTVWGTSETPVIHPPMAVRK